MKEFDRFVEVMKRLRAEDGCPWDREQTHETLKLPCIEEAAEVVCAVNILNATGNADNLKEELGDLLMQVVMNAQIAEEEGLFTMADVLDAISDKMIRRHPHVFGTASAENSEEVLRLWDSIKKEEKQGKEPAENWLPQAFEESKELIESAKRRKGYV